MHVKQCLILIFFVFATRSIFSNDNKTLSINLKKEYSVGFVQRIYVCLKYETKLKFTDNDSAVLKDEVNCEEFFVTYIIEVLMVDAKKNAIKSSVTFEKANQKKNNEESLYACVIGKPYLVEYVNGERVVTLDGIKINKSIFGKIDLLNFSFDYGIQNKIKPRAKIKFIELEPVDFKMQEKFKLKKESKICSWEINKNNENVSLVSIVTRNYKVDKKRIENTSLEYSKIEEEIKQTNVFNVQDSFMIEKSTLYTRKGEIDGYFDEVGAFGKGNQIDKIETIVTYFDVVR